MATAAPQTSPTAATATAPVTPTNFSVSLLNALGIKPTAINVALLNAQQTQEGAWISSNPINAFNTYNPLNVSENADGTGPQGTQQSNGVIAFSNWNDGVTATADFMNKNDPNLVTALQNSDVSSYITNISNDQWAVCIPPCDPAQYGRDVLQAYTVALSDTGATADGIAGFLPIGQTGVNDVTQVGTDAAGAAKTVVSAVTSTAGFLGDLESGTLWKRIGMGALGLVLCLIGIMLIMSESKTVQSAAKVVGK
jgi:hypothetical protein